MPASGEQHISSGGRIVTNPFEETKPRVSEYTAQEIATLQSRLEKQLGPEYISSRAGPSGQKVHYLAAEKCIQLANEIFGFNGWSSQIMDTQVDFVDENPNTLKVSLGLSVIVRVTLRDGTFHEDVGYGHIENCKGKAPAFEKAKKEGTTDALKRALRNFGNVLGNCIYDKEYLTKVIKVKVQPAKWDIDRLHRHSTYAPIKRESATSKIQEEVQRGPASIKTEDTLDDEFGDFDEADFSVPQDPDSHPDEVVLPGSVASRQLISGGSGGGNDASGPRPNGGPSNLTKHAVNHENSVTALMRPPTGAQDDVGKNGLPQTPNSRFVRSTGSAGPGIQMRPPHDSRPPSRASQHIQSVPARMLNQPSRNGPPSGPGAPDSPAQQNRSFSEGDGFATAIPQGPAFFSARAVPMVPEGQKADEIPAQPNNLTVFNPHAESPSIRKTPGIDHNSSKPLTRDLKHVPGSSQIAASAGLATRGNIVNPQLDATRRIGVPGSPSPMVNRGMYKPPTLKRPSDVGNGGRVPLVDLLTNGAMATGDSVGDAKRQRLNGN